jgi:micrococcal nuclease
MLSNFKDLVKSQEDNILLSLFIILIILISFGVGYLISPNKKSQSIIIQKPKTTANIKTNTIEDHTPDQATSTQKDQRNFTASKESDKYHHPDCAWGKKISSENRIWFDSEKEAKKAGYQPCSYIQKYKKSD